MEFYFAPLEGITGYLYRQVYHAFYTGIDRYYIPFIVPKEKKHLNTRERNDVMVEHNAGMMAVPQIMTNKAEEFLRVAVLLHIKYGYKEVNLNLGCPSKTVVSQKRGSGFLSVPDQLNIFLEEVCNGLERYGIGLSIKTRIGKDNPEEFANLLEIFAQHPIVELIVHPRIQKDFYHNRPNLEAFRLAYEVCQKKGCQLCYNGDLFDIQTFAVVKQKFPALHAAMLGRGLLMNPMLVEEIKVRENGSGFQTGGKSHVFLRFPDASAEEAERKRRLLFYQSLQNAYKQTLSGERDVLFKMKELWQYMVQDFTEPQKYWKQMKKAQSLDAFSFAAEALCFEKKLRNTY